LFFARKVGLLVPASNTVCEPEFYKMGWERLIFHVARVLEFGEIGAADVMEKNLAIAAQEIGQAGVSVAAFCCTAGSFMKGLDYDRTIAEIIEKKAKTKAVTASTAVREALKSLASRKIAVATPYPEHVNREEKKFLEGHGFRVVAMKGLGLTRNSEVAAIDPEAVYEFAKGVNTPDADAIFISCTNLRTIDVIEKLEREVGKPVVTSNQATFWATLRKIQYPHTINEYGALLKRIS